AIGFALVGLPSPVVFGALAAVTALIPRVGTALVWVPAAAALFLQGRWVAALFLLGWSVAVVSSADNVVRPLFISGRAQISTLPVFLGLLGGLSAFGPIGLVLARWRWPSRWPCCDSRRSRSPPRPRPRAGTPACAGSACSGTPPAARRPSRSRCSP